MGVGLYLNSLTVYFWWNFVLRLTGLVCWAGPTALHRSMFTYIAESANTSTYRYIPEKYYLQITTEKTRDIYSWWHNAVWVQNYASVVVGTRSNIPSVLLIIMNNQKVLQMTPSAPLSNASYNRWYGCIRHAYMFCLSASRKHNLPTGTLYFILYNLYLFCTMML